MKLVGAVIILLVMYVIQKVYIRNIGIRVSR